MVKSRKIYLDYAASVSPNPSSIHALGLEAKIKLENARKEVASVLKSRSEEIIFTSGGTESNNLAIQGIIYSAEMQGFFRSSDLRVPIPARPFKNLASLPHIITTNIEHPSVLETFKMLKKRKLAEISIVPVEKNGIVDAKKIKKEIKKNTVLISVMYANNEIGTIQPIREIAKEIRYFKKKNLTPSPLSLLRRGVGERWIYPIFHTDAVQAVNYLDLNVEKLGVDLLSLSGSKIEGAGLPAQAGKIGVLYKKKSVSLTAIFGGGDQEMGLRPGTENLAEILKFSKALKLVQKNKKQESARLKSLQDYFIKKINIFDFILNGDLKEKLPNIINITFPKIPSDLLVIELSAKGIMASSKSACKSSQKEGSYVIQAIRSEADIEIGGLRFSLGKKTTKADIDYTIKTLSEILQKLKKWYN